MSAPHHQDPRCKELFALLSEYVDGELPASTCGEIEAHFADCPPCLQFLDNFKQSISLTKSFETTEKIDPPDPELRAHLESAWQEAVARRK